MHDGQSPVKKACCEHIILRAAKTDQKVYKKISLNRMLQKHFVAFYILQLRLLKQYIVNAMYM